MPDIIRMPRNSRLVNTELLEYRVWSNVVGVLIAQMMRHVTELRHYYRI